MLFTSLPFHSALSAAAAVGLGLFLPTNVHSHGFAWDPMSRNTVAHEYGVGSGSDSSTDPIKTYNDPGLENGGDTFGACGALRDGGRHFTKTSEWVMPNGNPLPFNPQATYTEGQEIIIRSYLTANHKGHIEIYACSDIGNPTDACFRENALEFVEDQLHGAPKDPNYPYRAMIAPSWAAIADAPVNLTTPSRSGDLYVHRFKLPEGLYGDEILLQWYWISANGCRAQGYVNYPWPADSWHPSGSLSKTCELPYADCSRDHTGRAVCKNPQIFRNCVEVKIEQGGPPQPTDFPTAHPSLRPSISKAPTGSPTLTQTYRPSVSKRLPLPTYRPSLRPSASPVPTASPTDSPTTTPNSAAACCSDNYRDCHHQTTDVCNLNEAKCMSCNRIWLSSGALAGCAAYNEINCNDGTNPCCEGLYCKASEWKCRKLFE